MPNKKAVDEKMSIKSEKQFEMIEDRIEKSCSN
jgi:hypothetical protein